MIKYYKLLKDIPGGYTKGHLFKLEGDAVYCSWNTEQKDNLITWDDQSLLQDDLEMTEYFEESVGISADGYILFKGDIVFTIHEARLECCDNIIADSIFPLYYKRENIPVEKTLPKSWEDLKLIKGYFTSICSDINIADISNKSDSDFNVFKTESQCKSALAFAQLSQLVAEINEDWQPNWSDKNGFEYKYFIERLSDRLHKESTKILFHPLVFKTKELRDFSFEHHKQLWLDFFELNNNE